MRAQEVYELLVIAIDKVCDSHGFLEMNGVAVRLGMTGGEVEAFNSLRYEYAYKDGEGQAVDLNVRSYDPSGPFQNEPDINRFTAKLHVDGREVSSHDRSYTD